MNQDQPPREPSPISYEPDRLPPGSTPPRRPLGFGTAFLLGVGIYILVAGIWYGLGMGRSPMIAIVVVLLFLVSTIFAAARRWWGFVAAMFLMMSITCLLLIGACFYEVNW